jgi:heterodisulfide reductase subunit C2
MKASATAIPPAADAGADDPLREIRTMVGACIQCGTCSGSCPNAHAMDYTPRQLWRMVLMGEQDRIFESKTFALCSACYTCSLRCPRGLPLTEAMAALKQAAARADAPAFRPSARFYRSFLESVRRHGRVRESEFMTLYFLAMKNPLLPLKFAPLGLKLMGKGKLQMALPSGAGRGVLAAVFDKVAELEGRS